jgi:hypothetical protein
MMLNETIQIFPILGCTAHEDQATHDKCREVGMIKVVIKPLFPKII